jgi:acetoin utilization protein AcuC
LIFADVHESGASLYPGTGAGNEVGTGAAQGTKLNIALPAGSGDAEFNVAWQQMLRHLGRFEPEFFILQCGADSVDGDPLTHLHYSAAMHAQAAGDLCELAARSARGRVLALGGGGYDRGNLAAAWTGVVTSLLR